MTSGSDLKNTCDSASNPQNSPTELNRHLVTQLARPVFLSRSALLSNVKIWEATACMADVPGYNLRLICFGQNPLIDVGELPLRWFACQGRVQVQVQVQVLAGSRIYYICSTLMESPR